METNQYMVKIDDGRLFLLSPAEGKRVLDIIVFTNAKEVNFQVESGGLMEFKTDHIEKIYPIDENGDEIITKKDGKVFILDENGMYEQGSAEDLKYNYTSAGSPPIEKGNGVLTFALCSAVNIFIIAILYVLGSLLIDGGNTPGIIITIGLSMLAGTLTPKLKL